MDICFVFWEMISGHFKLLFKLLYFGHGGSFIGLCLFDMSSSTYGIMIPKFPSFRALLVAPMQHKYPFSSDSIRQLSRECWFFELSNDLKTRI